MLNDIEVGIGYIVIGIATSGCGIWLGISEKEAVALVFGIIFGMIGLTMIAYGITRAKEEGLKRFLIKAFTGQY